MIHVVQSVHAGAESEAARQATFPLLQDLVTVIADGLRVTVDGDRIHVVLEARDAARAVDVVLASPRHAALGMTAAQRASLVSAAEALLSASRVVIEAWDRGALDRDRALLALFDGAWSTAALAAREALAQDPEDDTSALVAALATVEGSSGEELGALAGVVRRWLLTVEKRRPGHAQPAAVVRALLAHRTGDPSARELFEELVAGWRGSAVRPPPLVHASRFRASALRPTSAVRAAALRGEWVWMGAGPFSPLLHLARLSSEAEDDSAGDALRRLLLQHMHDRLAQGQHALLPVELELCRRTFGTTWAEPAARDSALGLVVSPIPDTKRVTVAVRNDGSSGAEQAALLVLTRARPDDRDPGVTLLERRPRLRPLSEATFGEVDLAASGEGAELVGALVLTEDLVAVLRTDKRLVEDFAAARARSRASGASTDEALRQVAGLDEGRLVASLVGAARLEPDEGAARVVLPETVTPLRPQFRLSLGNGARVAPSRRELTEDGWVLTFDGAAPRTRARAPTFRLESAFGAWLLTWKTDGGAWVVDSVTILD